MARTVNAEAVLAALQQIEDVLSDRAQLQQVRISVARRRLASLCRQIENQAVES